MLRPSITHCSNLWVNEMTKIDLLFLKSTLAEIRHEQKAILSAKSKIRKKEQRQAAQEEIVRESKRKINRINKLSKTHEEWVSEKKREISDVKTTLKEKRSIRKSRNLEIEDTKAEKAQIEEQIKMKKKNEQIISGILVVLLLLIGTGVGVYMAKDFPRGEWVCDDGSVIELLDVQDGQDHCPDGSDEDTALFSNTRADDASESEESIRLGNEIATWWILGFGVGMIIGLVSVNILFGIPSRAIQSLDDSVIPLAVKIEQLGKVHSSGDGIGLLDKRLKKIKLELANKSGEMTGIDELKARKSNSETQIKNNKVDLENQLKKIELKEILIKDNWEKISHLIPYSESIKLL